MSEAKQLEEKIEQLIVLCMNTPDSKAKLQYEERLKYHAQLYRDLTGNFYRRQVR